MNAQPAPSSPFADADNFLKAAQTAADLGFISALFAGVPETKVVKAATAHQPAVTEEIYHELNEADKEQLFRKYANEWRPHRQKVTTGYLEIILGKDA